MPVVLGPYRQSKPSCFHQVKTGFVVPWAWRLGAVWHLLLSWDWNVGWELMGGIGKTMMQSGGTFGTFMAIGRGT
uniref:Reactive oxygen species modulator 1 n=1 Tax=Peromyscus maniculatus bairdii TaxID=230844 RepID=A0A8C8UGH7_PERMB